MVTDPNEALNPETVKTAVSAYNAEINKLQGITTAAQGALWGLQKAAEASSKV
jgi:hypothetical protein